jgi:anti-sigma factor ChrR (cupin superfamily)
MTSKANDAQCERRELASLYAADVLPAAEAVDFETHLSGCAECRREVEEARSIVAAFVAWPTDLLRPSASLQQRLAGRIAAETGGDYVAPPAREWTEPDWEEVAPGIFCKILASDAERDRVTMLVRLLPGVSYPPHTHAGVEELHLLDGELWIDDRLLYPGDYNYGEPGASDARVYSETGCTCVLITSPSDQLR